MAVSIGLIILDTGDVLQGLYSLSSAIPGFCQAFGDYFGELNQSGTQEEVWTESQTIINCLRGKFNHYDLKDVNQFFEVPYTAAEWHALPYTFGEVSMFTQPQAVYTVYANLSDN